MRETSRNLRPTPGLRFGLVWVVWLCAATLAAGQQPSTLRGDAVLDRAIRQIQTHQSLALQTRQSVDLLGKQLNGIGSYSERRDSGWLEFRLEMTIPLTEQPGASLVQVCDGQYLWTHRRFREESSVERVDVGRVFQAWEELGSAPRPTGWPGPGGLANMLSSLNSAFDFPVAQPVQMGKQGSGWKLEGDWKPNELAKILPEQALAIEKGESPDLSELPPQLPATVVLWLATKDSFPRRIEYHRPPTSEDAPSNRGRTMMSIDFHNIQFNVPIPDSRFHYNPGDYTERTQKFIENMRLER